MPSLFRIDGLSGYIFDEKGGQHNNPHIHVYYAEYQAEVYFDGSIKSGDLPKSQLNKVRQWLRSGGKKKAIKKWRELNT